jgi:site-specific recombinase XerD
MSLAADLDAYIAQRAASDWNPRSVGSHRSTLHRLAAWLTQRGHRRWASVTGADLDAWFLELRARGLRRASLDAFAYTVRGFGAWLAAQGRTLTDPAADLRVLDTDEADLPPAPLSEEQVVALFALVIPDSVAALRNRLHLELLYSCGLRNGEASSLAVGDLDLDSRTLLVRAGKGGRPRLLPLLAHTLSAAADYLALRRELLRGPDTGILLLSNTGRRLPTEHMQRWLAVAGRELGFRVHPHLLRHSIAVHLLRRGADIRHIQQFLGHADLETTKVYLRLVPGHLREDYDRAMPMLLATDPLPPVAGPEAARHG